MHAIYATPVISIHAPTRGATYNGAKYFIHCADFNPRSHEGSDIRPKRDRKCGCIFQSTLPRGERPKAIGVDVSKIISIHAPTRGATSRRFHPSKKRNYFNPRSHEGSDKAISCKNKRKCKISIHAPTRGATDNGRVLEAEYLNFNPRSHEGSDLKDRWRCSSH